MKTIRERAIPVAQIEIYIVTGKLYSTHRSFKPMFYSSLAQALQINLWRGSVWARMVGGKRVLIKRVHN